MILALALFACTLDDVTDEQKDTAESDTDMDTDTDTDTDTEAATAGDINDAWLSEGADISALFQEAPFSFVSVAATFNVDLGYTVVAMDGEGAATTFAGTFVVDATTSPGTITLTQSSPYTATSVGIYQVDADTLTYEAVQTVPDYGFTPPTPETGFGTTAGPGVVAGSK